MNIINECLNKAAGFFRGMNNEVRTSYEILGNPSQYQHLDKLADLIMLGDKEGERLCEEYGVSGFLLRTQLKTIFMERRGDHVHTCARILNAKQYRDEVLSGFVMGASHEGRPIIHFLNGEFTPYNVAPSAIVGLDVIIGPGANIEEGVKLASGVKIGAGCDIEKNADIRTGTIIGNFCRIAESTTIEDSDIGAHSFVNRSATVFNATIGFCASISTFACIGSWQYHELDQKHARVFIGEHFHAGDNVQVGQGCEFNDDVYIKENVSVEGFTVIRSNVQIEGGTYKLPRGTYELNKFAIFVRPRFTYEFENFAVGNSHFPAIENEVPSRHRMTPSSYAGDVDGTMYASVIALWNEETKAVDFIHTGRMPYRWDVSPASNNEGQLKGLFDTSRIFTKETASEVIKTFFGSSLPIMEAFLVGMNRDRFITAPAIMSPAYLTIPEEERKRVMCDDSFDSSIDDGCKVAPTQRQKRRVGKK